MTTGIVLADTAGRIVAWDDGATELLGHPADAAVGASLDLIVPPAYRDAHWAAFHRAVASGECRLHMAATNLPVLHADGGERVLPARFVFLTDARGAVAGAAAVYASAAGGEEPWGEVLAAPDGGRP